MLKQIKTNSTLITIRSLLYAFEYNNNHENEITSLSRLPEKSVLHYMELLLSFIQTLWQRVSSLTSSSLSLASKMLLLFLLLLDVPLFCNSVGYSYSRFVGPVTGPEEKIFVRDVQSGIGNVDYVAHPKYQFAYGVEDSEQRILQNRKETRDGDNVHGVYSVVDPDGSLRVVKYTADNVNGFQAEVITNGVPVIYGHSELNDHGNGNANGNAHKGNGYWEAELPSDAAGTADYNGDEESGEDYETANEGEDGDENDNEYDAESEIGSSEEDFEDAEGVIADADTDEID